MIAARTNVHNTLDGLIGESRRLRQEEITSEIVELSSVSLAAGTGNRARRFAKS
jgi:F-type H+-transporting ATPase subunit gamma